MELRMKIDDLALGLFRAQGVVEKKSSISIVSNVLLETMGDDQVRISATDLEIELTGTYPAEVFEAGRISVGAKNLYDIVRHLPGKEVYLKRLENDWVEVKGGAAEFKVAGASAEDFPAIRPPEDVSLQSLDAAAFLEMLDKTLYAVSNDETRYNLNGALFHLEDHHLIMVSTDGYRLAKVAKAMDEDFDLDLMEGVIIPRKGLLESKRILDEKGGACLLGLKGNSCIIQGKNATLTMRLIEGKFPDYNRIIPKESKVHVDVPRLFLIDCLRRMSIVSPEQSRGVSLKVQTGGITISSQNVQGEEGRETLALPCEVEGELMVGFNSLYLIDALQAMSCDEVILELSDPLSPAVLRSEEENYICVVMPVRL